MHTCLPLAIVHETVAHCRSTLADEAVLLRQQDKPVGLRYLVLCPLTRTGKCVLIF